MDIVWAIVVGLFAGIIAKLVTPGGPNPRGFILTAVLGIVGAVLATYLGQAIHLYQPGETANFLGQIIGAIIILLIWRQIARPR
ncbi:MAG: GlsB/YeaQ/YmgE family stress response membrane protein [Devosia sp.]